MAYKKFKGKKKYGRRGGKYRGRKYKGRKGGGDGVNTLRLHGPALAFPDRLLNKLRYTINANGGGNGVLPGIYYANYINTLYQADASTTMPIPYFLDCAGIYAKYRVYGVKIRAHFNYQNVTNKALTIYMAPLNTTSGITVSSNFTAIAESTSEAFASQPWAKIRFVNAAQSGNQVLTKYIDLRKFIGPNKQLMVDDLYMGATGGGGTTRGNPANLIFMTYGVFLDDGSAIATSPTAQININIQYTWYVEWSERILNTT